MKDVDVRFGDGQEVLSAYWGFLADGGLIISGNGLDVGEAVSLSVHIESSKSRYLLAGTVVRLHPGGKAIIAFNPGEPHDMLLTEALAETDNVPARRFRRYPVCIDARAEKPGPHAPAGAPTDAPETVAISVTILNLSLEGCCLRVKEGDRDRFDVGEPIRLCAGEIEVEGLVVWVRNTDRGVKVPPGRGTQELLAAHVEPEEI